MSKQSGPTSTPPRIPSIGVPPVRETGTGHTIPPSVPNVGPSPSGPTPVTPKPNPAGS